MKHAALKHVARALLLGSVALFLFAGPAPAATSHAKAAAPCWKRLLNDWYDGTINNIYPLPCYQEAINHLPPDVSVYSSAKDDIQAAEAAAAAHKHAPKEKTPITTTQATTTQATTTQATTTRPTTTQATTTTSSNVTPPATTTTKPPTTTAPPVTTTHHVTTTHQVTTRTTPTQTITDANPPKKKHGFSGVVADITPGDPQSFPLPLLVLGALAIILVAAGGAGMIWQRTRGKGPGDPQAS